MGAGLLAVKSGVILFIKDYQFSLQINTLERERERERQSTVHVWCDIQNGSTVVSRLVRLISWFSNKHAYRDSLPFFGTRHGLEAGRRHLAISFFLKFKWSEKKKPKYHQVLYALLTLVTKSDCICIL
jgi:hypothetical protein